MPIEELLALYRCPDRSASDDDANDEDNERPSSSCDLDESDGRNVDKDDIDEDEDESELRTLYPETFAGDQRHLRSKCFFVSSLVTKVKLFTFVRGSLPSYFLSLQDFPIVLLP